MIFLIIKIMKSDLYNFYIPKTFYNKKKYNCYLLNKNNEYVISK